MGAEQARQARKPLVEGPDKRARLEGLRSALAGDITATLADIEAAEVKERASMRRVLHTQRMALAEVEAELEKMPAKEASAVVSLVARSAARRAGAAPQKRSTRGQHGGGGGGG